jgi:hypothetical protein
VIQQHFVGSRKNAKTHLFDLTWIGETSSSDTSSNVYAESFIRRIDSSVFPEEERDWRVEVNKFGKWLCERASAYQNAYNISAEQASGSKFCNSRHRPTTARAYHASFEPDRSEKPYKSRCYCCNEEHRVLCCPTFKAMPTEEKIRFCIQPKIVRSKKDAG